MPRAVVLRELAQPVRLDKALRALYPDAGRQAVQTLVTAGQVKVNGKVVRLCSWQVSNGDRLALLAEPPSKPRPPAGFDDAWIIAEEPGLIAVDKPAGLLSEPARSATAPSLLGLATARFGPVTLFHRLDRDTSGVVLLTRSVEINRRLDAAFKAGSVEKEYLAVVAAPNRLAATGVISHPIGPHPKRHDMMAVVERGGKPALTRYEVIAEAGGQQWLRLWPRTGRTHQLRVHLAHLGAPILGDRLYNPHRQDASRLMLHALRLTLPAEVELAQHTFAAPPPPEFPQPPA